MRFLADESCDFAVVRALRAAGHDVAAVGEFQQRSVDRELMERAAATPASVTRLIPEFGHNLQGAFVVLRPGSIRVSRSPLDG